MQPVPVIAIVGGKESGKTTLVAALVRELSARGYRIGTQKHTHRPFEIDQRGKDSWVHRHAGAAAVFVVGGGRMALIRDVECEPCPGELAAMCPDLDLFIVEGFSGSTVPRIEIGQRGSVPATGGPVLALALESTVDDRRGAREGVPRFHRDDTARIADLVVETVLSGRPGGDGNG